MRSYRFNAMASLLAAALLGALPLLSGCDGSSNNSPTQNSTPTKLKQTNLVSDLAGVAATRDVNLVNPWGIAFSPNGPFWIADNNSGKATLYNGAGAPQPLVVQIPSPMAATGGTATGQVFNGTTDFKLPNGESALFIFSTEDGTIVAWSGSSGTQAVKVADRSAIPTAATGAVYKGLAIGSNASGNFLYATNFRAGTVDVFDKSFAIVNLAGPFTDPNVPAGYAPFGIQNIGGDLYVTYAKQDVNKHDDVSGAGNGLISVFDSNGNFKRRIATGAGAGGTLSALNSPWGMALTPSGFGGIAAGSLLVGNFGDGHISVLNPNSGALSGQLQDNTGTKAVAIPGLWGLTFGNGGTAGAKNTLFFTAGIGDAPTFTNNTEQHGLFGSLTPIAAP